MIRIRLRDCLLLESTILPLQQYNMNMTLADNLRGMGFRPCKAYPDLWMRRKADYYEYVAVMVDDLLVFSQEPVELIMELKTASTIQNQNTLLALSPMPPMITPAPPIPPEPPPSPIPHFLQGSSDLVVGGQSP